MSLGKCNQALGLVPTAADYFERCLELRSDYSEASLAKEELNNRSSIFTGFGGLLRRWRRK